MGSKIGVLKIAAKRIGISFEEYMQNIEAGLHWCIKCKTWKPASAFYKDVSRGSGLKSTCQNCDYQRITKGPGRKERREKAKIGLAWCRGCQQWLPFDIVRRGICPTCKNSEDRKRYLSNERYRKERRQHAHSRKRGTKPIPPEGQDHILEGTDGKCVYCGAQAETWDHIIPISKGGGTTPGNIVPACKNCNSSKKDKDVIDWIISKGLDPHTELIDRMALAEAGLYG